MAALLAACLPWAQVWPSELPSETDISTGREPFAAREIERTGMLSAGWGEAAVTVWAGGDAPGRIELRALLGLPRSQLGVAWDGPLGPVSGTRAGWLHYAYERRIAGQPTPTRQVSFGMTVDVPAGAAQPAAEVHLRLRARTGPLAWSSELGFGRLRVGASRAGTLTPGATGPRAIGVVGIQVGPLFFDAQSHGSWDVIAEKRGWIWVEGGGVVQVSRGLEVRAAGGRGWLMGEGRASPGDAWWSLTLVARGG